MAGNLQGEEQFQQKWAGLNVRAKRLILEAFGDYSINLARIMREDYLSGQVLNRQTSKLFETTRERMRHGGKVAEFVATPYGVAWEYGFNVPEYFLAPKDKKALRWESGGNVYFSRGHWMPARTEEPRSWARPALKESIESGMAEKRFGSYFKEIWEG